LQTAHREKSSILPEFHQIGWLPLLRSWPYFQANQKAAGGLRCPGYALANNCLRCGASEESIVCSASLA
jgi:hypothetical protein